MSYSLIDDKKLRYEINDLISMSRITILNGFWVQSETVAAGSP